MNVWEAKYRRTAYKEGILCGEVEARTDHPVTPDVLVYFIVSKGNGYDMVSILGNDADTDIDWYENNLHQAFTSLKETWFDSSEMKTDWGEREKFKEQVLSYGTVRDDLDRVLTD